MARYRIGLVPVVAVIGFVLATFSMGGSAPKPEPEKDAGKFVLGVIYSGMSLFADQTIDPTERDRRFAQLVAENLDMPRIARFVVGRYWNPASEREREEFIKVYPAYLARAFGPRIGQFTGAMVSVSNAKTIDGEVRINSTFEFPGPRPTAATVSKMEIAWLVRATPDGFKIEDIDYQGVSLKLEQRTDVMSIIARMGETITGLVRFILESLT